MKASEFIAESNITKLAALGQYLIGRANDKNATSKLSVDAFLSIAQKMGIPLDVDSLTDMVQTGELQNIVDTMSGNEIKFKSAKTVDADPTLSIDRARNVVNNMAKRAMNKRA